MNRRIHTPAGVRDIFGLECDKKRYLERQIEKLYRSYGYQSIETPGFEFFEVFGKEVGTMPARDLYKFFDADGNTLALRPDFTPAVARAASLYFSGEDLPLRFCYHGNVFRNTHAYQGRLCESTQMGVELLNDDSPAADAEVIALAVSTMQRAGFSEFQVTVGHADYFRALAEEAQMDEQTTQQLQSLLAMQNRFGAQELIERLHLRSDLAAAFVRMPELFGDAAMLSEALRTAPNAGARRAVERLQDIYQCLRLFGCERYVTFDLGMVTEYRYYTGIILAAYTYASGDALLRGGRYDRLIEHFGKQAAAVGFAADVDALLSVVDRQHIALPVKDIKTMALYPASLARVALRFAAQQRMQGLDVACVPFAKGRSLADYEAYGRRNQFGGIIYFAAEKEVYAIHLATGERQRMDPFDTEACADGAKED